MSLIPAEQHFAVFTAVLALSAMAFASERTVIGQKITGTVVVILLAIAAANTGLIPHSAPAYSFIFSYIVPMLIPLFLFQADVRRLAKEASRTTAAFLVATLGTVTGVIVAALLLDLSQLGAASDLAAERREAGIVGLFASTYIGGSVNYAALGEITGLSKDASFFSAATAADNLFSAVFLSVIALIPGAQWLTRRFIPHTAGNDVALEKPDVTPASIVYSLAAAGSIVAVTDLLCWWLDIPSWRYAIMTLITVGIATALPQVRIWFAGAFEIGVALSFTFFAAIAAGADIRAMISVAPLLIVLVLILLSVHLIVLLAVGRRLGLTIPELLTASNAAILGATTAPAMAAAKGWHDQVTPGVLVGVIGYALGTFIGTALFQLW
ncbi:putative integral membrane protein [gamma proteobacterium HIMB55]|nr:putative integral membrane protein [gamma proteobacterium HIMB55]